MTKILLDPGHGAGSAHNRGFVGGDNEGDVNFSYSTILRKELEARGFEVGTTRSKISDNPSLDARGAMGAGYDLLLSLHSNAMGTPNSGASGTEIWDSVQRPNKALAQSLCIAIAAKIGIPNRGVKYKEGQPGSDWYGVLRNSRAQSAMLVEHFFHDNPKDVAKWWKVYREVAKVEAEVLAKHYKISATANPVTATAITGKPSTNVYQMQAWARAKKAHPEFVDLAPTYYNVGVLIGVDPAVLYAQSAKETGYMHWGGVLDATFKNPCGMKTSAGGGNYDPKAHQRFTSWEEGITAQADHLALYAGALGYPKVSTPDPRHFPGIWGTAPSVEALGGKWAGSATYGTDIIQMIDALRATKHEKPKEEAELQPKYGVFAASIADDPQVDRIVMQVKGAVKYDRTRTLEEMFEKIVQVGGSKLRDHYIHIGGSDRYGTDEAVAAWITKNR